MLNQIPDVLGIPKRVTIRALWYEVAVHSLSAGVAVIVLMDLPVKPIGFGDTFFARAGCDKAVATCSAKFGNVPNFRGYPTIPGQDTVLRYASDSNANDGTVL